MKKFILLTFTLLFLFITIPAFSADYNFRVDKNYSNISINRDGSVDIEYFLTFTTNSGAKAINIVDIGLPSKDYNISTAMADLDGATLSGIKPSSYIPVGVEVPLSGKEINPGETKTIHFTVNNPKMIFQDDADPRFASVEFYPTYYGSQYTSGSSDLKVSYILPAGVTKDQVVARHNPDVVFSNTPDGRLIVTWQKQDASPSQQYKFGLSIPVSAVDTVYPANQYTPASDYYTYSGSSNSGSSFDMCGSLIFFGIIVFFLLTTLLSKLNRKNHYLPPEAKIEGFGANKELKEAEVAIIKELPLKRVGSIIIAKLLKEGIIKGFNPDNTIKAIDISDANSRNLENFEIKFAECLDKSSKPSFDKDLEKFFTSFIRETVRKMKNFNRSDTINYYENLVLDVWQELEYLMNLANLISYRKAATILESNFILLMTDKDFAKKIKPILTCVAITKPEWLEDLRRGKDALTEASEEDEDEEDDEDYYYRSYNMFYFDGYDYYGEADLDKVSGRVVNTMNPVTSSSYGGGHSCACACACACAGGGR